MQLSSRPTGTFAEDKEIVSVAYNMDGRHSRQYDFNNSTVTISELPAFDFA